MSRKTATRPRAARPIFSAYEVGRTTASVEENPDRMRVIDEHARVQLVYRLYLDYDHLDFLPVAGADGKIHGYLQRQMFLAMLSRSKYSSELLLRPEVSVSTIMDPRVVLLEGTTPLAEAAEILMRRDDDIRFDPFVVTVDGEVYGVSSVRRVLDGLNQYLQADLNACLAAQRRLMQYDGFPESEAGSDQMFATFLAPLSGPGGDFVRVLRHGNDLTTALLFDVCGKGLKAATMVSVMGALFARYAEDVAEMDRQTHRERFPDLLRQMNSLTYELTPEEMYATGVALLIDRRRRIMLAFDYGHGFLWLRRDNRVFRLSPRSMDEHQVPFFGINPELTMEPRAYRLHPGDLLFCCSDGVVEARNQDKEEFGAARIAPALRSGASPDEVLAILRAAHANFRGNARLTDDRSMLCIAIE